MKLGLAAILLGLFPSFALGGTANVTSGEHNDFSRLVVTLPEAMDWRFGRAEDGYTLSVAGSDLEYDLTKVFNRIPKTRLADVAQIPGRSDLHVVAACACHATAFAFRPSIIVIDIRSGPPPSDSPFEADLVSLSQERAMETLVSQAETPPAEPDDAAPALDWVARLSEVDPPPAPFPPEIALATGFRESLAQQLGSAASQGLVDLSPPVTQPISNPSAPEKPASFRVVTEAGIDLRLGNKDAPEIAEAANCFADEVIDLPAWGGEDDPPQILSSIHQSLITDAERIPAEQLVIAAQKYLYLGFGVEARQALSQLDAPKAEDEAKISMAFILEGGGESKSAFAGMENCNSAAALWAVLARDHLRPSEAIASGAIVRSFATLPLHLRKLLAARLMDRLLEQGDRDAAEMVRATIARAETDVPTSLQLAQARLDLQDDATERAEGALNEVAARAGPDEPEALVTLVDVALEQNGVVSADRIAMIETLAMQNRNQPVGKRLQRALVISYALAGEFPRAKSHLADAPDAEGIFWSLLAKAGGDADLLSLGFLPPSDATPVAPESAVSIAGRLLDLGFSQQSLEWLNQLALEGVPQSETVRLLTAKAQLAQRDPRAALEAIAGLGAVADPLRAQAFRDLGRMDEAVALLQARGDSEDLLNLQRVNRRWADVAKQEAESWSLAADLAVAPATEVPNSGITLAYAQSVAASAESSRQILDRLLEEARVPLADADAEQ